MEAEAVQEQEFTYEYLEDIKKTGKGFQVLIKWLGYGENDNTWEPITNIHSLK